jgi:hypothetical protein
MTLNQTLKKCRVVGRIIIIPSGIPLEAFKSLCQLMRDYGGKYRKATYSNGFRFDEHDWDSTMTQQTLKELISKTDDK